MSPSEARKPAGALEGHEREAGETSRRRAPVRKIERGDRYEQDVRKDQIRQRPRNVHGWRRHSPEWRVCKRGLQRLAGYTRYEMGHGVREERPTEEARDVVRPSHEDRQPQNIGIKRRWLTARLRASSNVSSARAVKATRTALRRYRRPLYEYANRTTP
jgi:hypothetical protein